MVFGGGVFESTSTELLTRGYEDLQDSDKSFQLGPDLPVGLLGPRGEPPVAVAIGQERAVFVGPEVWLYDARDERLIMTKNFTKNHVNFSFIPFVNGFPDGRIGAFAGIFTDENDGKRKLMVAGGKEGDLFSEEAFTLDLDVSVEDLLESEFIPFPEGNLELARF